MLLLDIFIIYFFFNDTATTEIYTLSLHDALPILLESRVEKIHKQMGRLHDEQLKRELPVLEKCLALVQAEKDRKSTRLNSSHSQISYAVFCLKKKKKKKKRKKQNNSNIACLNET